MLVRILVKAVDAGWLCTSLLKLAGVMIITSRLSIFSISCGDVILGVTGVEV